MRKVRERHGTDRVDRGGYDIRLEAAAPKEWNTVRCWEIIDTTLQIHVHPARAAPLRMGCSAFHRPTRARGGSSVSGVAGGDVRRRGCSAATFGAATGVDTGAGGVQRAERRLRQRQLARWPPPASGSESRSGHPSRRSALQRLASPVGRVPGEPDARDFPRARASAMMMIPATMTAARTIRATR